MTRFTITPPGHDPRTGTVLARGYAPGVAAPPGMIAITGGQFELLLGGFSGIAEIDVSAPVPFRPGDWLRVWLNGTDAEPDYLGELTEEPWQAGAGVLRARGLTERLMQCRWKGRASGRVTAFLGAVFAQAALPPGVTVGPLQDTLTLTDGESVTPTFQADTPHETLGDTLVSILPALGGWQIGVNNRAEITLASPLRGTLTHRFPIGRSETPPGSLDRYANCLRVPFEYPNGDPGMLEARADHEVDVRGEVWDTAQVTALEVGAPLEPHEGEVVTLRAAYTLGGLPDHKADVTRTGPLAEVTFGGVADRPFLNYVDPPSTPDPGAADVLLGRAANSSVFVTFGNATRDAIAATIQGTAGVTFVDFQPGGYFRLLVQMPMLAGWMPSTALEWLETDGATGDWVRRVGGVIDPKTVDPNLGDWQTELIRPGLSASVTRLVLPEDWNARMILRYTPAYLAALHAAGYARWPQLRLHVGGNPVINATVDRAGVRTVEQFRYSVIVEPPPVVLEPSIQAVFPDGRKDAPFRTPIRQGILRESYGEADRYDPVTDGLNARTKTGDVLAVDFAAPLTLPVGTSIDFLPDRPDGQVGAVWTLPDLTEGQDAERIQRETPGVSFPDALLRAAQTDLYPTGTRLDANGRSRDGWLRFAVRGDFRDRQAGRDVKTQVVQRLILTGLTGVSAVRIRTPDLSHLIVYGAELLRYRTQPVREWRGRYLGHPRLEAYGVAAFESQWGWADVLLDVQTVVYDLSGHQTIVTAGTPLPATDEDATIGEIQSIRREIRRAGGQA